MHGSRVIAAHCSCSERVAQVRAIVVLWKTHLRVRIYNYHGLMVFWRCFYTAWEMSYGMHLQRVKTAIRHVFVEIMLSLDIKKSSRAQFSLNELILSVHIFRARQIFVLDIMRELICPIYHVICS